MWYEIIPSFAIISTVLAVPHFVSYGLNWAVVGNMFRRKTQSMEEARQYLRDIRLGNDAYKVVGLEAIPDE